jgi:tetratricopeptide (TPR) repeat protein
MGKREEGLDYVKRGIRLDLTSHICWHVFGLIQKGEKKYEEALKSYTQALRFDKARHTYKSIHLPLNLVTGKSKYPQRYRPSTITIKALRRTN